MRLIVSGAGRGGTNLLTELIKKISDLNFTTEVEDRNIMSKNTIPKSYATKLAIENTVFTKENITKLMNKYDDLFLGFSLRHPMDNCMSKIVRGQKSSEGGDKVTEILSTDATVDKAVESIYNLYEYIDYFKSLFPNRVFYVKMEDIILNTNDVTNTIKDKIGLQKINPCDGFQKNNRNRYQKGRYGNSLDAKQVGVYKQENPFNGFFNDKMDKIKLLNNKLDKLINTYYEGS